MDSPITNLIERELTSIWRILKSIIHRNKCFVQIAFRLQKLHLVYKCGISSTKTAFRLQILNCQFTKLHFELQSCISACNSPGSTTQRVMFRAVVLFFEKDLSKFNKKLLTNKRGRVIFGIGRGGA